MKKNLLTIIIIALLIVNIVLTGIMMISMMGTNKKTADLVSDIAAVLNLELGVEEEEEVVEIPMSQQFIWNLTDKLEIPLQSEDIVDVNGNITGKKDHYIVFETIAFSLDTEAKGYKEYGENIANYESMVRDAVTSTVSKHTIDDCRNDFDTIRKDVLEAVRALFDEEFIYNVAISGIKYQ
mgnify:FL=1